MRSSSTHHQTQIHSRHTRTHIQEHTHKNTHTRTHIQEHTHRVYQIHKL